MAIVVQKFGGSSLADLEKLGRVADLVVRTRLAGHDLVVVVSAMGKATDGLLDLARAACRVERGDQAAEPPRRELDMLVSTGERVSMALLSIAIRARGGNAVSLTGSQSGIITNDRHFDARIIEVRPHRIEDELARGRIVIVAGYQGVSYRREITTLGRGGSDTTAVALAAALGAERCEIYSDVDGVYTADPRHVEDARHLPELDYETMQEMAECGAKVLNAQAVEWARRSRVTIHARRTADFADGERGRETTVSGDPTARSRSLAVVADRTIVLGRAPRSLAPSVLSAVDQAGLEARDVSLGPEEITFTVSRLNAPDFDERERTLRAGVPKGLTLVRNLAQLSVVGVGAGAELARILKLSSALGEEPRLLLSTPLRVSVFVAEASLALVEHALHTRLVIERTSPIPRLELVSA
jgi:aspartate kinase